MTPQTHARLLSALTDYDRRASKRKGHNPYALGHYCGALGRARESMEAGATLRQAILDNYNGRLLSAVLKAVGEPDFTREEQLQQ